MHQLELDDIVFELSRIADVLERALPPVPLPVPPERKLGKEAITFFDEEAFLEHEDEEIRDLARGIISKHETNT